MVRLGHILILIVLISVMVVTGCGDGGIDPDLTTYTIIEEQSSHIGTDGGQIQLGDGSNAVVPEDTFDESVTLTLSRRSARGELPSSIEEDPDSRLISDFYFLESDMVLDGEQGIAFEIPFDPDVPSDQVRVLEIINIGNETYPFFVDSTVDEASHTVSVSDAALFPSIAAIHEYEEACPPTEDLGFYNMTISIGYAAISDTYQGNSTLSVCSLQTQSSEASTVCKTRFKRITCYGERADVSIARVYGTGVEMMEYAHTALQFAESIQEAYTEAGFETLEKVKITVSPLSLGKPGMSIAGWKLPGLPHFAIQRGLITSKGEILNYAVNHETVHTMQKNRQPDWWKESSANWIAYYFEPDETARQQLHDNRVFSKEQISCNPYMEPFPWSGAEYDYDVLIDFAVEAGRLLPEDIVQFINEDYVPTDELTGVYRDLPDEFAQHLAERGQIMNNLRDVTSAREHDYSQPGSVTLSIDVDPLTLPFMYFEPEGGTGATRATFSVSLQRADSTGGIVIGSDYDPFQGSVTEGHPTFEIGVAYWVYFFPFAIGSSSAEVEVLLEWEPLPAVECDLTISSTEGGSTTPAAGTHTYEEGAEVDLMATPASGYQFLNWDGDDVSTVDDVYSASTTITMNDNYSITANFGEIGVTYYTLSTAASPSGGGSVSPSGGSYAAGTQVSLTATPASGYTFSHWAGDASGSQNPVTITMNSNKSVTAYFEELPPGQYSLTVSSTSGGSVTSPGEGTFTYDAGTVVDLVASPASGYQFVNWTGNVGTVADVDSASTTITMDGNYSIIASFEEEGDQVVHFPDPNLEAAIRQAIGKPTGDIYQSDLVGLTSFSAQKRYITDLTGLEYCTSLTELSLRYNQISDISPLTNLTSLQSLDLRYWNQISDISPLTNLTNLTELYLSQNEISDISPLAALTKLTILYLNGNQIGDISPLANLTSLTSLILDFNQISDISPLASLTALTVLQVSHNGISNISPLANLTALTWLYIHDNQISDISPLASLTSLTSLGLWGNQISDVSPLANLTSLTQIFIYDNQISDISPLAGLTGLGLLAVASNQISDISPLASLTSLANIWLNDNQISDISALAGLANLRYVLLDHNQISDISPLVENEGVDYGDHVDLRSNPLSDESINDHIPALQARHVDVHF